MSRSLVQNLVQGVSEGYTRKLEISGVGYRAAIDGKILNLQLGFSHDIKVAIPDDIKVVCDTPTAITISGADKQRVGQIAVGDPPVPPARALQGQGREICRGAYPPQGRQEEVGHDEGC